MFRILDFEILKKYYNKEIGSTDINHVATSLTAIILAVTHNVYSICNYLLPSHLADGSFPNEMPVVWFPIGASRSTLGGVRPLVQGRPRTLGIKPKTFNRPIIYTNSLTTAPPSEWVVQKHL